MNVLHAKLRRKTNIAFLGLNLDVCFSFNIQFYRIVMLKNK